MSETTPDRSLPHLNPPAARLGAAFARPRLIAVLCVVGLAMLGWLYLALMVAGMAGSGQAGALGPGMGWLAVLQSNGLDGFGRALLDALCRPSFGGEAARHFGMPSAGAWKLTDFALIFLMWCAMVLAMMLPSAGPMILTYAEIADTAARKGEPAVSPLVLAAGYGAVWLGFASVATLAQGGLSRLALIDPAMASTSTLFSGAVFIGAGVYQFSSLKHSCVTRCQNPFPFFFANWTTAVRSVFRLGLRQGLYCLGCCWAMMLVMFAVGLMNVVWMAVLGIVMTLEKIATTTRFSRIVGVALSLIGIVFIASAVIAHWPAAAGWGSNKT
jgi:predicted metal-binding membrane protein